VRVPKFGASPATSAGYRAPRAVGVPTPPGLQQSQELAQAMSTFGQGLGALGEQMQAEVDEAEVQSAANKFDEYTRGVLDPMKGFRSKLGRDAKDGYEQAVQDLEEKRKEFGNTLQNARQRELYERYSNSRRDRTRSFLDSHAATQVRAYNIGEKKATVDGHAEDYVGLMTLPTPDDPAAAARLMQERRYALAELRQTAGDYADLMGQGPQERAQTVRNAERAAHAAVVQGLIAAGRYDEAEAMMRTGDDDAGIDYYMDDAIAAGIEPEDGHWASRIPNGPNRGMILKKPHHPTFHKTLKGEKAAGMKWFYRPDNGRYYTFPDGEDPGEEYVEQEPSAGEMRASLTPLEREKYRAQIRNGRAVQAKQLEAQQAQLLEAQRALDLQSIVDASAAPDVSLAKDLGLLTDEEAQELRQSVTTMPTPLQRGMQIRQQAREYARKNNLSAEEAQTWLAQTDNQVRLMTNRYVLDSQAAYEQAMQALQANPSLSLNQMPNLAALQLYNQAGNVQSAINELRGLAAAPRLEAQEAAEDIWRITQLQNLSDGQTLRITPAWREQARQFGVLVPAEAFPDNYEINWNKPNPTAEEVEVMRASIIMLGAKPSQFKEYYGKLLAMHGKGQQAQDAKTQVARDAQIDRILFSAGVDIPKTIRLPQRPSEGEMDTFLQQKVFYEQAKARITDPRFLGRIMVTDKDNNLVPLRLDSPIHHWIQAAPTIRERLTISLPDLPVGPGSRAEREAARRELTQGDTAFDLSLRRSDVAFATPEALNAIGITPKMQDLIIRGRREMMVVVNDENGNPVERQANLVTTLDDIVKTIEDLREGVGDPELRYWLMENSPKDSQFGRSHDSAGKPIGQNRFPSEQYGDSIR
jgi:hypothetical protein